MVVQVSYFSKTTLQTLCDVLSMTKRKLRHGINQSMRRKPVFDVGLILALVLICLAIAYRSIRQSLRQTDQYPPIPLEHQKIPYTPSNIPATPSNTHATPIPHDASVDQSFLHTLKRLGYPFDFLEKVLPNVGARPLDSDLIELRHCHLAFVDYANYTAWALPILDYAHLRKFMVPEFSLGLLEIYATQMGLCDFAEYPLQITDNLSDAEQVLRTVPAHDSLPRLAIVIVAFKDAAHLKRLIKAVHLPHHFIIIHLERLTSKTYSTQVRMIASLYKNVAVVQFGTIAYRTDSVSMINYQIMNWLVNDLKLEYNYHFSLDGAVYPLYSANELAQHLQTTKRDVWLGEILHNGKVLVDDGGSYQWISLARKRFLFTKRKQELFITEQINRNGFVVTIPEFIKTNMTKRTNSGNQGVFSQKFVKELTNSPQVKELFALAKYGCCCCIEESSWIAAASILGYAKQAMEATSMFQVWGGETACAGGMRNAVLSLNASLCFKTEDASENRTVSIVGNKKGGPFYLYGHDMLKALKNAKKRGFMFARKFNSEDPSSMELLRIIQRELHLN
jgi:hypothetical protein